jgi:hypothetical protein
MPMEEALARKTLSDLAEAQGEQALAADERRRAYALFERIEARWHIEAPVAGELRRS